MTPPLCPKPFGRLRHALIAPALALLAPVASALASQSIISLSVNEVQGRRPMAASDLAGATPDIRVGNWNNILCNKTTPTLGVDLVYADGSSVDAGFSVQWNLRPVWLASVSPTPVNDQSMYSGFSDIYTTGNINLAGIPFEDYDIYVYARGGNTTRGGSIALSGGPTYYLRGGNTPSADGTGYVSAITTGYDPATPSSVTLANHVVFDGLSGPSQTIQLAALNMGDAANPRLPVSGVQIVQRVTGATYWVDPAAATNGDGTQASPFNTLPAATAAAVGGDTIYLQPGHYGTFTFRSDGGTPMYQEKYVTIEPAPGVVDPLQTITFDKINLRHGHPLADWDCYLRIKNVRILDGVWVSHARHVQLIGCLMERLPPWTGDEASIGKIALDIRGNHLLVENCEFTRTAMAITAMGNHNVISGNHIHNITHDGIRLVEFNDGIVENNRIHNLDDGVDDSEAAWSKHCDGIHMFVRGGFNANTDYDQKVCKNVIIRGNIFYNAESQNLIINGYPGYTWLRHRNITIENNIFGPSRAMNVNLVEVDHMIFRNNTYVYVPGGTSFVGAGRTLVCTNWGFRLPGGSKNLWVYNNLFAAPVAKHAEAYMDYNAYIEQSDGVARPLARNEIMIQDPRFVDAASFDGKLLADSPLKNAGSRIYRDFAIAEEDLYGTPRDNRPDIGAVEIAGQSPAAELPPASPGVVTVFVDDFRDYDRHLDPILFAPGQQGLSWVPDTASGAFTGVHINRHITTQVTTPAAQPLTFLLTEQGETWGNATIQASIFKGGPDAGGFVVRGNTRTEGYLIDLMTGKIHLRRATNPEATAFEQIELHAGNPAVGSRPQTSRYRINVMNTTGGAVQIELRNQADDALLVQATDSTGAFPQGRFGLFNNTTVSYKRNYLGDVRIEPQP